MLGVRTFQIFEKSAKTPWGAREGVFEAFEGSDSAGRAHLAPREPRHVQSSVVGSDEAAEYVDIVGCFTDELPSL